MVGLSVTIFHLFYVEKVNFFDYERFMQGNELL
ncbi:DUF4024 domain-containing protein [Bacillus manliponensis]|nr:DUF4024 domain-containing protein [Bacillus manliponensis]